MQHPPFPFIVDTNVMVAGLLTSDSFSPTARILNAMLDGRLPFLLSPALLDEYYQVLRRPKLQKLHGLADAALDVLLTELVSNAMWREALAHSSHTAPDPGDRHLWSLLTSEAVAALVTGDQLLLHNPPPGRKVISPAQCIALCQWL